MGETMEQYRKVYGMLEDEESRDIYLNRLNWLISGEQKYLDAIVSAYLPKAPLFEGKTMTDLKKSLSKDRKVVLYGAGMAGKELLRDWANDERFVGFCSQTKAKQRDGYCGYPVMSPEELLERKDLNVIIATLQFDEEIRQILLGGGYPAEQIFSYVDYYFYEDPEQYFGPDFMKYEADEVLVDAGCYNLNSSLKFREHCGRLKKIYAFEPDPENYAVCLEKKARFGLSEVQLFPAGVWSEETVLHFSATNDGGSHISEEGAVTVPVMSIDETVDPADRVTMIKMDIEGAELEALNGARKVIQRDRPKLAICIYHKPEDMTEIPLYIKELVPEYKLYVRHHSNIDSETVLYAI